MLCPHTLSHTSSTLSRVPCPICSVSSSPLTSLFSMTSSRSSVAGSYDITLTVAKSFSMFRSKATPATTPVSHASSSSVPADDVASNCTLSWFSFDRFVTSLGECWHPVTSASVRPLWPGDRLPDAMRRACVVECRERMPLAQSPDSCRWKGILLGCSASAKAMSLDVVSTVCVRWLPTTCCQGASELHVSVGRA